MKRKLKQIRIYLDYNIEKNVHKRRTIESRLVEQEKLDDIEKIDIKNYDKASEVVSYDKWIKDSKQNSVKAEANLKSLKSEGSTPKINREKRLSIHS